MSNQQKTTCYHCGEDCLEEAIAFDQKQFCCAGCRSVYEILSSNDLCNYYDLEATPGITPPKTALKKFAYLENEEIIEKLIDFKDHQRMLITFYLPQIHCSSCVWLLENLYRLNSDVYSSRINFLKKELKIAFNYHQLSLRKLVELLTSLGYEPSINFSDTAKDKKYKIDRSLIYKFGVAGFAFGNIMMLSLPEYFGLDGIKELSFAQFFGYINIILSLPVLLYSASDYLKSAWIAVKHKTINIDIPITLGIIALFVQSVYEIMSKTGAGYLDSLAGLLFFMLLGKIFQQKTYSILSFERDYKSYFPISTIRIEPDGEENSVAVSDLKVGDVILVRNNEIIPVDAELLDGDAKIDNSFVTGESLPVEMQMGDKIYAGGKQKGAAIQLRVLKEISNSYLTQLWNDEAFSKQQEERFTGITNTISKYFTLIIIAIALGSLFYWWNMDKKIAIHAFTSVLIIACPCALALSAPFTFGNVLRILGKSKFYLKNASIIEQLAKITTIVFDKTGTLTQSNNSVVNYKGNTLTEDEKNLIASVLRQSSHPLSKIIYATLDRYKKIPLTHFEEIAGKGLKASAGNQQVIIGSAKLVGANGSHQQNTVVYVQINHEIKGKFELTPTYRKNLAGVIQQLAKQHQLHLISGDNNSEQMQLAAFFPKNSPFLFSQTPEQKLHYIKKLQQNNEKVAMIGDGLNDAGALKQSDVGISISEDVNTFSPACDAILEAEKFHQLPIFIDYIKTSIRIVTISFIISFLYNIIGLSFAVQGLMSPVLAAILMPLSSITVVTFVTLATNISAKLMNIYK
ncbi:MAG TPA: heavy metal translocating P-type ATPase metal-binding domain-containing protein [Vicingaceae bacterium]|nr:heavy metal translocating P-type ATPase metal-binding domain-containing protein [Vicingaceae bacterium]